MGESLADGFDVQQDSFWGLQSEDKQAVVEQLTQVSKMLKLKVTYELNFSMHLSVCESITGLESVFVTV